MLNNIIEPYRSCVGHGRTRYWINQNDAPPARTVAWHKQANHDASWQFKSSPGHSLNLYLCLSFIINGVCGTYTYMNKHISISVSIIYDNDAPGMLNCKRRYGIINGNVSVLTLRVQNTRLPGRLEIQLQNTSRNGAHAMAGTESKMTKE